MDTLTYIGNHNKIEWQHQHILGTNDKPKWLPHINFAEEKIQTRNSKKPAQGHAVSKEAGLLFPVHEQQI